MKIEYEKKGMIITHPTGVIQILSVEDLERLKNSQAQRISEINASITRLDAHIAKAKEWQK